MKGMPSFSVAHLLWNLSIYHSWGASGIIMSKVRIPVGLKC